MSVLYKEIPTENSYKDYIQKFWILDNSSSPLHSPVQYGLPNGCCTITFISGNGLSLKLADNNVELSAGVYLSGQITKRTGLSLQPYTKAIMAQVMPWLPPMITRLSMSELVDRALSLEHININMFQKLMDTDLKNEAAVTSALYKNLNTYLNSNNDSHFTQWVFSRLKKGLLTQSNIADIAIASGYSQRRVEQKLRTLVGPTAKEMQRILQLRRVIDDMHKLKAHGNLSTLAVSHGYYDQSHFIKSYQRIMRHTPVRFDSAEYILPISGHFDFLQSLPLAIS